MGRRPRSRHCQGPWPSAQRLGPPLGPQLHSHAPRPPAPRTPALLCELAPPHPTQPSTHTHTNTPTSAPALLRPVLLHSLQQVQTHGAHQLPHPGPEVRLACHQGLKHACRCGAQRRKVEREPGEGAGDRELVAAAWRREMGWSVARAGAGVPPGLPPGQLQASRQLQLRAGLLPRHAGRAPCLRGRPPPKPWRRARGACSAAAA